MEKQFFIKKRPNTENQYSIYERTSRGIEKITREFLTKEEADNELIVLFTKYKIPLPKPKKIQPSKARFEKGSEEAKARMKMALSSRWEKYRAKNTTSFPSLPEHKESVRPTIVKELEMPELILFSDICNRLRPTN